MIAALLLMMTRERDYAYEALAEATGAHMDTNRGELNAALASIREQSEIEDSLALAMEITEQATRYRLVMGDVLLTPSALAKHWTRLVTESARVTKTAGTNLATERECQTCGGDRFVLVATREPKQTRWMEERGIKPNVQHKLEEYAPCPSCNPSDSGFRRYDGSRALAPDPAKVREMMKR